MRLSSKPKDDMETNRSQRVLVETLIVFTLTVVPSLLWPSFKIVSVLLPIAYLLIERRLRNRPWGELGFDTRGIAPSLTVNWFLILIVLGVQVAVALLARTLWPAFLTHIESRLPLFDSTQLIPFLGMLVWTTLGEEMAFRSLFQERLSWFIRTPIAILAVSVVFGLMHWAQGDPLVAIVDVALVVLDSILYGIVFSRGKNVYVAWLAHLLADVVAVILCFAL